MQHFFGEKSNQAEGFDALLSEAFLRGRRGGLAGLSSSLTTSSPGTAEFAEEMRGWYSGHNEYMRRLLDSLEPQRKGAA